MIAYIRGKLVQCQPAFAVVDTGGVAYLLQISLATYSRLRDQHDVQVLTHMIVKEDGHYLYGFAEEQERQLFIQLISVNGVGPNTARVILSSLEPSEVRSAIARGDDTIFKRVKGIGPKTAQRIIIDLKDKVMKEGGQEVLSGIGKTDHRQEAMVALQALGFARIKVEQVLRSFGEQDLSIWSLEDLIKNCLKKLS